MKFKAKTLAKLLGTSLIACTALSTANVVYAQQNSAAPVICPGYERGPTKIPGQRVGRKVQSAFEAYSQDLLDEAIEILREIDAKDSFDRAYVDRFLGNLLASKEGQGKNALDYLLRAVSEKNLNDSEHAQTLRLVADLNMQQRQFPQAIEYYEKWMEFTCKSNPDVYTRQAQAFYETQQLDKMIAPADKAIALYEKPNKNPYVLKLTSYFERKMYPETISVAEDLVNLFPENKQWWSQLGFFYMLVEDFESALRTFDLAYQQGFLEKASEIRALAQLYGTNGAPYKAAKLLEDYIESGLLERNESNLSRMANAWQRAKEHDKAARYYGEAAAIDNNPEHYRRQGTLLLTSEKYPEALAALQKALDAGSEKTGSIHMAMMEANFYQGKFKEAHRLVELAKQDSSVRRNAEAWEPYIKEKARNRGINI